MYVCVVSYLTVVQFYLLLWLAVIHFDVVRYSQCLPTLWLSTFNMYTLLLKSDHPDFQNSFPVLQMAQLYSHISQQVVPIWLILPWKQTGEEDLVQRCRCENAVRWMDGWRGSLCSTRTPWSKQVWRLKGGQVVTLVRRTRSPLLFTPQVYKLQPSSLVVFTWRESYTYIHTYSM